MRGAEDADLSMQNDDLKPSKTAGLHDGSEEMKELRE